jgi:hypothetical protein
MKKNIVLLACVFLSSIFKTYSQDNSNPKKIRLDLDKAVGGSVSEFIKEVNYIPLETPASIRIDAIIQLQTAGNFYVLLISNSTSKNILIFNKKGIMHSSIAVISSIQKFSLTKNLIEVVNGQNIEVYDLSGKLLRTIPKNKPYNQFGITKIALDSIYQVFFNTTIKSPKDSLLYQLHIYRNDWLVRTFLPYPKLYQVDHIFEQAGIYNFSYNLNDADKGVFYTKSFDYKVYRVTPNSLQEAYQFIFPLKYSLPQDFSTSPEYAGKKNQFLKKGIVFGLYGFCKKDNFYYFATGSNPYIFNENNYKLVNTDNIVSDSLSWYLPVSKSEVTKRGTDFGYLHFDGSCFYTSIPAQMLFSQVEDNKDKKIIYPPALKEYFNNKKNKQGNPVLVQIEFKKSF